MIYKQLMKLTKYIVLLMIVCVVVACGRRTGKGDTHPTSPHEPTAPMVFNSYSDITKISFTERFGNHSGGEFLVHVTITKDIIQYQYIDQDSLMESLPEVINVEKDCDEYTWNYLVEILNRNNVGNWKEQYYYINKYFGEQATLFEEWPEVRFAEMGDFFNLAFPLRYYGVDQNEKEFRSDYSGLIDLCINEEQRPIFSKSYDGYGLPEEYHHFEQEFWDYIIGYTGICDWRYELSQWGIENMYKLYPYMQPDDGNRQIRYFSLLESYGGRDSALRVSFVYDGGEKAIIYECGCQEKTYSVGKLGIPVLYSDKQPYGGSYVDKNLVEVQEDSQVPAVLANIVDKYDIAAWNTEPANSQKGYVRQGEFYNVENAKLAEDKNEKALRSGYDALLHVVYTNGEHIEVWLQNGHLPDLYNDFRDELWDYFIPYMNQNRTGEEQVEDWRDYIDTWGEEYMRYKYYPYMW